MNCPKCSAEVLDIDVRCSHCGAALGATGAHRMIGQVVLGTYELVDVLGQGGMSVVFKARHRLTEQEVALKILPPELAANSQVKGRFLEEAKALAALDHPNIVHLYNFGQENASFVLAMQFVQGKTWERLILEQKRLDWAASVKIAIDVLKALEYAHGRGVVHRDMKPSNVLVRAHDNTATVMDFGIAKMTTSTRLTATGQTMGTVRYMSPEQVRGQDVDLRTDIYSLGATLYESVVGETPFDGATHFEIMTKQLSEPPKRPSLSGVAIPVQVEDALMRCLAKRADDRFESARDLRRIFEAALRESDVGLSETQRLGRDVLAGVRSSAATPPSPMQTPSPGASTPSAASAVSANGGATATPSLADELEPGASDHGARARRAPRTKGRGSPVLLWGAVGGAVVLAGAAVATYVITRKGSDAYTSVAHVEGVPLVAGRRFERVLVETDGAVRPDVVHESYQHVLGELRARPGAQDVKLDVIDHIVALPQSRLCQVDLYPGGQVPGDCATANSEVTVASDRQAAHLLLVSDDARGLAATMTSGVADAVCLFQPAAQRDAACALTSQFLQGAPQGSKSPR